MQKTTVAVIYGGKSVEHEVSIHSAQKVCELLSDKFIVLPIFIDKQGSWFLQKECSEPAPSDKPVYPVVGPKGFLFDKDNNKIDVDVVFPVLHGTKGEDGAIQGLFEMAEIPFTGCGVLASAMGMNKEISKIIAKSFGVPVLPYVIVQRGFNYTKEFEANISTMGLPVFVKPVSLGSSVGVTKVKDIKDLKGALDYGCKFDSSVMIEKGVDNAREIFCAIYESENALHPSLCGELLTTGSDFFDYNAKYVDPNGCMAKVPANIDEGTQQSMQLDSLAVFKGLNASGLARIDFLMDAEGEYYFSEINTLPGMSASSLFPQLWTACKKDYKTILETLVAVALKNAAQRKELKTDKE